MGGSASAQCKYARFVDGTEEAGYSKHLVSWVNEDPKILTGPLNPQCPTVIHAFRATAERTPHKPFLGRRDPKQAGEPYVWMTFGECQDYVNNLARGIKAFNLMEDIQAEGRTWNFMGIYGKNRPEWVLMDLASATLGGTSIAFYDTLGPQAIDFVIKQTELTTITCTAQQLPQLIILKNQGKAQSIKTLISMDDYDMSVQLDGEDAGIKVMHINEIIEMGKKHSKVDLSEGLPSSDDIYMFCYTSGTTGDPKAAMLSYGNLMASASATFAVGGINFNEDDVMISYLPLAHSFEKCMFTVACICGMSIGYYNGDPHKLLDDVQVLKPTCFPSVPRLFNRIYDKIQAKVKSGSSLEQSVFNRAVASKLYYLENKSDYLHSLWDRVCFNKIRDLMGGRVRLMVTGSAPIAAEVLNYLKVCFCSPILEGYG